MRTLLCGAVNYRETRNVAGRLDDPPEFVERPSCGWTSLKRARHILSESSWTARPVGSDDSPLVSSRNNHPVGNGEPAVLSGKAKPIVALIDIVVALSTEATGAAQSQCDYPNAK